MHKNDPWLTRGSLIARAKNPDNQEAWEEFIQYYQSFIRALLVKMKFSNEDIEDLNQVILTNTWKGLHNVELNPEKHKFRSWFATVIRHAAYNHLNKSNSDQHALKEHKDLKQEDACEQLNDIDKLIESEWKQYIADLAISRIKQKFSGLAMDVFQMNYIEEQDAAVVSKKLNIKINSVYMLKKRVKDQLLIEINCLQNELDFV